MNSKIEEIETLIIENKLDAAAIKLNQIAAKIGDEDLINESLLILSRLNNFLNKSNQGVVDYFDSEFSKIRLSIISLKSSMKKVLDSSEVMNSTNYKNVEKVIFEENFDSNENNWYVGEDASCKTSIKNGRYFIDRIGFKGGQYFYQRIKIDEKRNFKILSRITFLNGSMKNGYGITWGGDDGKNQFKFVISADGSFKIHYYIEDEIIIICDWTDNPIIRKGKNMNILEIVKNGNILHYKINREVVFTSDFVSFLGDQIGLTVSNEVKIVIDFFNVSN